MAQQEKKEKDKVLRPNLISTEFVIFFSPHRHILELKSFHR